MSVKVRKKHLSIVATGFFAYLSLPFVFWTWLLHELEAGSFPPEADSIGIPMAGFLFLWFVGLFVCSGVIYLARQREFK